MYKRPSKSTPFRNRYPSIKRLKRYFVSFLKEIYVQEVLIWEGRLALKNSGTKFKKHTVHPYGRMSLMINEKRMLSGKFASIMRWLYFSTHAWFRII